MIDCLILHVPKFQNRYRALGNYTTIQWMSLGIFGVADAVRQAGFSVKIMHLGLENALNPAFRIAPYVRAHAVCVVAFSVQFHHQLYDTLRAAKNVRAANPDAFIVMGGLTASFFAKDLLEQYPCLNAIITGEGERPLTELVRAAKAGQKDLSEVSNLVWRKDGQITYNPKRYVAAQEDLDALNFSDLTLMEHYQDYVQMPKVFSRLKLPPKLRWKASHLISRRDKPIFFALPVGRGCMTNCYYCGGGAAAHAAISGRLRVVFRSHAKVMETMRQLKSFGYHGAYISFDPQPEGDAFYRKLFQMMRAEGLKFELSLSAWALPSREFLYEYSQTFSKESIIVISAESGSERVRDRLRGMSFSNQDLFDRLQYAEELQVRTAVFFSLGLPFETKEDFQASLDLKDEIKRSFHCSSVSAYTVEIEPAAPYYMRPENYGITVTWKGLEGFIEEQQNPMYSPMYSLGYYQNTLLGEPVAGPQEYAQKVLKVKCDHFCDQRAMCNVASCVWGTADLLHLSSTKDVEL